MNYYDFACRLLEETNDGDKLMDWQLNLCQFIVNEGLVVPEAYDLFCNVYQKIVVEKRPRHEWGVSIARWRFLYMNGPKPEDNPWDTAELSYNHQGYVYWRGRQVEHFNNPEEQIQDAWEVIERCRYAESLNVLPTSWQSNLIEGMATNPYLILVANLKSCLWQKGNQIAFAVGIYKVACRKGEFSPCDLPLHDYHEMVGAGWDAVLLNGRDRGIEFANIFDNYKVPHDLINRL